MTKKRRPNRRERTPRVEPLEKLLNAGESETYGQLCWSLANRSTERHSAGDAIKLDGWDENGKAFER